MEKCQIEGIIALPSGVFQPYSGVGTAILIFTKGGKTDKVWFYEMKADGYTLDQKRELIDGKGDIPDIIDKFKTKKESPNSFIIDFETIKKNEFSLSVHTYKKVDYKEIVYERPEKTIENYLKDEQENIKELKELKEWLLK